MGSWVEVKGSVNGRTRIGHQVSVVASAVSDHGKAYETTKKLFVAHHNPWTEWRSTRATGIRSRLLGYAASWLMRSQNRRRT